MPSHAILQKARLEGGLDLARLAALLGSPPEPDARAVRNPLHADVIEGGVHSLSHSFGAKTVSAKYNLESWGRAWLPK